MNSCLDMSLLNRISYKGDACLHGYMWTGPKKGIRKSVFIG